MNSPEVSVHVIVSRATIWKNNYSIKITQKTNMKKESWTANFQILNKRVQYNNANCRADAEAPFCRFTVQNYNEYLQFF